MTVKENFFNFFNFFFTFNSWSLITTFYCLKIDDWICFSWKSVGFLDDKHSQQCEYISVHSRIGFKRIEVDKIFYSEFICDSFLLNKFLFVFDTIWIGYREWIQRVQNVRSQQFFMFHAHSLVNERKNKFHNVFHSLQWIRI